MHNTGKSGAQIHSARGFWVRLKLGGGQCWPHWSEVAYCELALDGVSAGFWSVGTHTTSSRTSVERRRAARARRSLFSRGEEDLPVRIAPTTTWLSQYTVMRLPAAWGEEATHLTAVMIALSSRTLMCSEPGYLQGEDTMATQCARRRSTRSGRRR